MEHPGIPATAAVRFLRERSIAFVPHFYAYQEHGGTGHAARSLGVSEHEVVKTLVMETSEREPLIVLMHGDREVSTRQMARDLGTKHVTPCDPDAAGRHSGYTVGGISPFGTRRAMPVFVESTVFGLARIYVNGGRRGFLVEIAPDDLRRSLDVREVSVAIPP